MDFSYIAARYRLGLASGADLTRIADQALDREIYSSSLGELATISNPIMSEVGPLFEKAMDELNVAIPDFEEAVSTVLCCLLREVLAGTVTPREGMSRVVNEIYHHCGLHEGSKELAGDSHDLQDLLSAFYAYDDINESRFAEIDEEIVGLARQWVESRCV